MIGTSATTLIGFHLVPEFTMIAFVNALEPLRMANQASGESLYDWRLYSSDGLPVRCSNGIEIAVDGQAGDADELDALFVCGGNGIHLFGDVALSTWLQQLDQRGIVLGGICTGSWLLAEAGLLDRMHCTIHWENIASLRERFPELIVSTELYEIDGKRYTCAGGTASLDMMLAEIRQKHGIELTQNISEQFMCDRIRERNDRQRVPLQQRLGVNHPKLAEAVSLMEANIEEPMTLDELSHHVGLSRRQLERLFQRYLQCVPTRYYLELRLTRGRQLLLQTSMPIVDIAVACGFVSAPHFSKCYRDAFGSPPREERRRTVEGKGRGEAPLSSSQMSRQALARDRSR